MNRDIYSENLNKAEIVVDKIKFYESIGVAFDDASELSQLEQISFHSALVEIEKKRIKNIMKKYQGLGKGFRKAIKDNFPGV